jgi:ligand-binding SRPBCC domain-containing protein
LASGSEQVVIDRPVGEVWAVHTKPETIRMISVNTTKYEPRGPMRKGTRIDGATKVVGKTVVWEAEVEEFVELQGYRLRSIVAPVDWVLSYTYQPYGRSTLVTAEQEALNLSGFFGKISEKIIVYRYKKDLRKNLANLKKLVEGDA